MIKLVSREDTVVPYRPEIKKAEDKKQQELTALMQDCWAEEQHVRPDFGAIKKRLKTINDYKYSKLPSILAH